ncbi:uncharacterized protein LOC69369 [Mus musculus]|uniref:Membrane-spanning 4-domains, subfamily A, member 20 n=2 Tax=Mus musculus TaxID=10090 RepID=G5E851_MOUSE|nr:uncharacterized protein LOC69369 [Mus musculus]EDL41406.1 mCG12892 [Mus musculus]|eukprot:NP_081334.1 uncharacterized protein LOC69369 [Mus musculus]
MSINEVSTFYIIKEDTIAMGGAQIMLGLIHNALGTLWLSLHNLEDKRYSIGHKLMLASICYLFVSGTFFINSGSSSITQGISSVFQHMFAIITNIISIFVAIFGLILLGYEFPIFESIGTEYIWSNMAGMMLLQISVMCAITELVIAILVLHWFITAHKIEEPSEEIFSGPSHSHLSSPPSTQPSMLELENVSEQSHPKDIEDENDVTN